MTKKVTRIKKTDAEVPATMIAAGVLLGKLGKTQDSINEIEKELKARMALLKAEAEKRLRPLVTVRDRQVNALFAFANPRKVELTMEKRTIVLSTGSFGWRLTTPRVETEKSDEEIIALLKKLERFEYVRTKEEVDREALLAGRPIIDGISYEQHDEFFVVPKQACKKPKTFTHAIDR